MDIIIMIRNVVTNYIEQFPATSNNAYKYFNYDNRVVDERVDRGDKPSSYIDVDRISNEDYDNIVKSALNSLNSVLLDYDKKIACEDALTSVIGSLEGGKYASKINANRYNVLLKNMLDII